MTISDSLDKLPGVRKVLVDVVDSRLRFRVSVEPGSPADDIFAECECPLIGMSMSRGLPDGSWYSLSVMSKTAIDRLAKLNESPSAETPVQRGTKETTHE